MKNITFDWIKRKDGTSEFIDFLNTIPEKDGDKLLLVMKATEEQGLMVAQRMKRIKKLDDNLYELRSKQSSNIQRAIYFQKEQNKYLITHGFTKNFKKATPSKPLMK